MNVTHCDVPHLFPLPPPSPNTTTTITRGPSAAVEPPGDCPLVGQSGVSPSIPPAPNDATSPPQTPPRHRPQTPPTTPPTDATLRAPTGVKKAANSATSPPPDASRHPLSTPSKPLATPRHWPQLRLPTTPRHRLERHVGWWGEGEWTNCEEGRGGREDVQGERRVIRRSPGFSAITRREGAPMVPPIRIPSSFPIPAVCATRRRAECTPPRSLFFVIPPEGSPRTA